MKKATTVAALMLLTLSAHSQESGEPELRKLSQAVRRLSEQIRPAVVQVSTVGFAFSEGSENTVRAVSGVGSGFIVDPAGYIVTNAHVVGGAKKVEVLIQKSAQDRERFRSALRPPSRAVSAEVIGLDREADIAILKVQQEGLPHLRFADSEQVRQGDFVLAAGSPLGLENSVTLGVVSSVARQMKADDPMIYIQTDAAINPGNSGGPLINAEGSVVGVNTMIVTQSGGSEGIGFAVPSNVVHAVYEQIRKYGRVRRGYIGVIAQTITPTFAEAMGLNQDWGVIVADVSPNGAAATAGIEVKDIILSLDGKPLENARQFGVNIYRHRGESVTLEILRNGQKLTKQVAVLERPKDPERLTSLVQGDENRIPQFGIYAVDLDEKVTPILPVTTRKLSGAVVVAVSNDLRSKGDAFQPGDVIYEINNKKVEGLKDLKTVIGSFASGQALVIQIERFGQLQFLTMRLE